MAAPSPRPGSRSDESSPGVRSRILCVDDSAVALKMCERWLGRDGHAVACVPSAEAALELLESEHFDLVLLDVNLPGLDGNGALAAIRERHHLRQIPVIMMSNDSMESRIVRSMELGAVDYMIKPFSHAVLQAHVTAALDRARDLAHAPAGQRLHAAPSHPPPPQQPQHGHPQVHEKPSSASAQSAGMPQQHRESGPPSEPPRLLVGPSDARPAPSRVTDPPGAPQQPGPPPTPPLLVPQPLRAQLPGAAGAAPAASSAGALGGMPPQPGAPFAAAPPTPSALPPPVPILILAVDDSVSITRQIEHFLPRSAGYAVTVASSGEQALAILAEAATAREAAVREAVAAAAAGRHEEDAEVVEEEAETPTPSATASAAGSSALPLTRASPCLGDPLGGCAAADDDGEAVTEDGLGADGLGGVAGSPVAAALARPLFDVILLDLIMPGMPGVDVAMRVKSGPPAWASIPILIMSSLDDAETTLDCRALGVDDILAKPPSGKGLRGAIAACVDRARQRGAVPAGVPVAASITAQLQPFSVSPLALSSPRAAVGGPSTLRGQLFDLTASPADAAPAGTAAAAASAGKARVASDSVRGDDDSETETGVATTAKPSTPPLKGPSPGMPTLALAPPIALPPPPPPVITSLPPMAPQRSPRSRRSHPSPQGGGGGESPRSFTSRPPSSDEQRAISTGGSSPEAASAPAGVTGAPAAAAEAEAEARRLRRLLQRAEVRNAELVAAMTDMQRSLRTLNAEARDLRVTTAALRDRDREQHSASQALGRRVRALLLEAARRGYVPAFAAPCPFRPAPPTDRRVLAASLESLHRHASAAVGGDASGVGAPTPAAGELFAPASLVACLRTSLPLQRLPRGAGGLRDGGGAVPYGSTLLLPQPSLRQGGLPGAGSSAAEPGLGPFPLRKTGGGGSGGSGSAGAAAAVLSITLAHAGQLDAVARILAAFATAVRGPHRGSGSWHATPRLASAAVPAATSPLSTLSFSAPSAGGSRGAAPLSWSVTASPLGTSAAAPPTRPGAVMPPPLPLAPTAPMPTQEPRLLSLFLPAPSSSAPASAAPVGGRAGPPPLQPPSSASHSVPVGPPLVLPAGCLAAGDPAFIEAICQGVFGFPPYFAPLLFAKVALSRAGWSGGSGGESTAPVAALWPVAHAAPHFGGGRGSVVSAAASPPPSLHRAPSVTSVRSGTDDPHHRSGGGGAPLDLGDSGVRVNAYGRVSVAPDAAVSAADVLRFWADLAPALAAGKPERASRFWQLLAAPAHRPFLDGSELRPLLCALVEWHPDLRPLRAAPAAREGYILLVLTSVFASLHGQRAPRISFADVAACNLVDALHVLASQPTRKVLPFSVDYYADATAQWEAVAGASAALGLSAAQVVAVAEQEAETAGCSAWDRRRRMPPGLATRAALALPPAAARSLGRGGGSSSASGGSTSDPRLSPLILDRIFAGFPRPLTSGIPDALNYADWLWFWLAGADRMAETSLMYWFRALDSDGDGFLGEADLRWAIESKAAAQAAAAAQQKGGGGSTKGAAATGGGEAPWRSGTPPQQQGARSGNGSPAPRDTSPAAASSRGGGGRGSGGSEAVTHVITSLLDMVRPAQPGRGIAPLDIKRAGAGPALFDALVLLATPVRAEMD